MTHFKSNKRVSISQCGAKLLLLIIFSSAFQHASAQDIFDEIRSDFSWVGMDCKMPALKPPDQVWIENPFGRRVNRDGKSQPNMKSYRRFIDTDGDGLCEVYDVVEELRSNFTDKSYGYPIRKSEFQNGGWMVTGGPGNANAWMPLVLLDKKNRTLFVIDIKYGGLAGDGSGSRGNASTCQSLRQTVAASYLLLFESPPIVNEDELFSEDWAGSMTDRVGNRLFPSAQRLQQQAESLHDCREKYAPVIAKIIKYLKEQ